MDFTTIVANVAKIAPAFWSSIVLIGAFLGILFTGSSLIKTVSAVNNGEQASVSSGQVIIALLTASLLTNVKGSLSVVWSTFTGGNGSLDYGLLSYDSGVDFGVFQSSVNNVLTIVAMTGGIFFFKGLLCLRKATSNKTGGYSGGDDLMSKAIIHMCGGAALVAIPQTLDIFRNTIIG